MSVHDVPRVRWARVLEEFSQAHRGWLATLFAVGPGPEVLSSTASCPLDSVTATRIGRHAVSIGVKFQGGSTVCVKAPRTLGIDKREDGAERALEIDAAGGEFIRLAFRATALPEELDGIAPAELGEPCEAVATPRNARADNVPAVLRP